MPVCVTHVDGGSRAGCRVAAAAAAARLLAAGPRVFCCISVDVRRRSASRMRSSTSSPRRTGTTDGELAPLGGVSEDGTLGGRSRPRPASLAVDRGTNRRADELLHTTIGRSYIVLLSLHTHTHTHTRTRTPFHRLCRMRRSEYTEHGM